MLGSRFGHFLDRPLLSLARCLNINPNLITVTGFLVTSAAALVLSQDLFWGGVLILLGGCFDILDGVVARANNRVDVQLIPESGN